MRQSPRQKMHAAPFALLRKKQRHQHRCLMPSGLILAAALIVSIQSVI